MKSRGTSSVNSLRPSDAYMRQEILTIIGSDNGLSPGRRQAIIWTNDGILLIGPIGTNFNEILIEIHTFSFKKKIHLKMSSGKWRPFCLGLNVLTHWPLGEMCDFQAHFKKWYFEQLLWNWSEQNATDNTSALVQVMACCRQATSHYLS